MNAVHSAEYHSEGWLKAHRFRNKLEPNSEHGQMALTRSMEQLGTERKNDSNRVIGIAGDGKLADGERCQQRIP